MITTGLYQLTPMIMTNCVVVPVGSAAKRQFHCIFFSFQQEKSVLLWCHHYMSAGATRGENLRRNGARKTLDNANQYRGGIGHFLIILIFSDSHCHLRQWQKIGSSQKGKS